MALSNRSGVAIGGLPGRTRQSRDNSGPAPYRTRHGAGYGDQRGAHCTSWLYRDKRAGNIRAGYWRRDIVTPGENHGLV